MLTVFFYIQLFICLGTCISMFFGILHSVAGQLFSSYLAGVISMVWSFRLGIKAHKVMPSKASVRAMIIYCSWMVGLGFDTLAFFTHDVSKIWSWVDTTLCVVIILGSYLSQKVGEFYKTPTIGQGLQSVLYKITPNILAATKIFIEGAAGMPFFAICMGHGSIGTRFFQMIFLKEESKDDKNRIWLYLTEVANWLTWSLVTAAWLLWFVTKG